MKKLNVLGMIALISSMAMGCSSEDIPQAHKGRKFDKTGALAFYSGTTGFNGPILGPGTYYTAVYGDMRTVHCGQVTTKETITALTKDGVQFSIDVYVRISANCSDDKSVEKILTVLSPTEGKSIGVQQLYDTYVRPALGKAVRSAVGPYPANDINAHRSTIFKEIEKQFNKSIIAQTPQLVKIYELNMNNLDFPDKLEQANVDRAQQSILKDKAIAERARVTAETKTAKARLELAKSTAANEAAKIDEIGGALKRNPTYLTYQLQSQMPGIYENAGKRGNLIITAPAPNVLVSPNNVPQEK